MPRPSRTRRGPGGVVTPVDLGVHAVRVACSRCACVCVHRDVNAKLLYSKAHLKRKKQHAPNNNASVQQHAVTHAGVRRADGRARTAIAPYLGGGKLNHTRHTYTQLDGTYSLVQNPGNTATTTGSQFSVYPGLAGVFLRHTCILFGTLILVGHRTYLGDAEMTTQV